MAELDHKYNQRDVDPNVRRCVVCSDDINLMTENVYWHSNCMKPIHAECFMNWIFRGEESTTKCLQCFKEEDKDYFIIDIAKQIFDPEFTAQYDVIQELQTRLQQVRAREREIGFVANLAYRRVRNTITEQIDEMSTVTGPRCLISLASFTVIGKYIGNEDFLSEMILAGTVVATIIATSVTGPESRINRLFTGSGSRNSSRNSSRDSSRKFKASVNTLYLNNESDVSNFKNSLNKNVLFCIFDIPETNHTLKILKKCVKEENGKLHESNEQEVINRAKKRMARLGLHKRSYRPTSRNSRTKRSNKSFTRNMSRKSLPKWI